MKVIVIGASGNLGTRLVQQGLARGYEITAFVRNPERLKSRLGDAVQDLRIVHGDASERDALARAIDGHDAMVSAAGHVFDGAGFTTIFAAVLAAGREALGTDRRLWFTGGALALSTSAARKPGGLLSRVTPYGRHVRHLALLEASDANWALACPAPMIAAPDGMPCEDLIVSRNTVPGIGRWARYAPGCVTTMYRMIQLPNLVVHYEDVASVMMANVAPESPFGRSRVGFALPRRPLEETSFRTAHEIIA